jgi:hypothetical protein
MRYRQSMGEYSGPLSPVGVVKTALGQRFDHKTMAFQGDQIADCEKRRTGQAKGFPCSVTMMRLE